jgi:predicted  nucleic acid-binding Zn-ribbon protein
MMSDTLLFCPDCGSRFEGPEHVCKGCGKLAAEIREELLAMSEKSEDMMTCPKCGANVKKGHAYCTACGASMAS